jgi:plastocyanin
VTIATKAPGGCLAVLALGLAGCGSAGEADPPPMGAAAPVAKRAVTVDIADFKFGPESIKVERGGTVTFVNMDKAPHTAETDVNAKTAEFDTGRLAKGQMKSVKLQETGRLAYFCAYHRFMEGTVEVVE